MRVWALPANEDWICDRFVQEWNAVSGIAAHSLEEADVIWLLSDWRWNQLPTDLLKRKTVVATVHHVVPDKFSDAAFAEFKARDQYVHAYHVPCEKTRQQVETILAHMGVVKPIFTQPFWINQGLWYEEVGRHSVARRLELGFAEDDFVVGSFQRDTEGSDLVSPKLEKGPDLFCDEVIRLHTIHPKVKVLLAGWRRQYVMARLDAAGVPYKYVERPSLPEVNRLYNCLDAYFVASRYEGGPQSIFECATIGIPIVSRDVGAASEILHPECIGDDLVGMICNYEDEYLEHAKQKVRVLHMPVGVKLFVDFFEALERRTRFSQHSPGIGGRTSDI